MAPSQPCSPAAPSSCLTSKHRICQDFTTSAPWCFLPDTSLASNASPQHPEQWAHWVMSRVCQSGVLQLPLAGIFLWQEAISRCIRRSIVMFISKHLWLCQWDYCISPLYILYLACLLVVISLVCPLCSLNSQIDMTRSDCKLNMSLHTCGHRQRNKQYRAHHQQLATLIWLSLLNSLGI